LFKALLFLGKTETSKLLKLFLFITSSEEYATAPSSDLPRGMSIQRRSLCNPFGVSIAVPKRYQSISNPEEALAELPCWRWSIFSYSEDDYPLE